MVHLFPHSEEQINSKKSPEDIYMILKSVTDSPKFTFCICIYLHIYFWLFGFIIFGQILMICSCRFLSIKFPKPLDSFMGERDRM